MVPAERTQLRLICSECAIILVPCSLPARAVLTLERVELSSNLAPDSIVTKTQLSATGVNLLLVDDLSCISDSSEPNTSIALSWQNRGLASIARLDEGLVVVRQANRSTLPDIEVSNSLSYVATELSRWQILSSKSSFSISFCPDSLVTLVAWAGDMMPPNLQPVSSQ